MNKNLPIDEFGNTVLTSKKKYEKCYFCDITIIGKTWFTFVEDKNCKEHVLSVPICDVCSKQKAKEGMGKRIEGL